MNRLFLGAALTGAIGLVLFASGISLPPGSVSFSQSSPELEVYDFVEITARISAPLPRNPFSDASIRGTFQTVGGAKRLQVEGFCDAEDGSLYRIRFMPAVPGDYIYNVDYHQGWTSKKATGKFHVKMGRRRGPVRIDSENRWHFIWEGTGEHYFFNGTTAYWLMGWQDERVIQSSIERLHGMKINRMRVTIAGRTNTYYGEPAMAGEKWTPLLTPWPIGNAARRLHLLGRAGQRFVGGLGRSPFELLASLDKPDDIWHPGFDYGRFRVAYWQKFERALRHARDRDMVFSLVLDMNDSRVHPSPGSSNEDRFIRYAVARFAAFSNITWDLGDDLDQYRDESWTHATGTRLKEWDPYHHLSTSHPIDNTHQDRGSDWFDFTSFQEWSRDQHAFMLAQRHRQASLGRIIPQTNEEYGYEDHHPLWSKGLQSDSADVLRRTAWEIVMAGGYQTAGETARRGTNIWPDTGGGWINGRGDETMTMFVGYMHLVNFFTSFDWWKTEPHDELVNNGNYCLAKPGQVYAIYLPHAGDVTVRLSPGRYRGVWWNPVTGARTVIPLIHVDASSWTSPAAAGSNDWALLLQKLDLRPSPAGS
jgi:hypothetical protein